MSEGVVAVRRGERQLFMDDRDVAEMRGVRRRMHRPVKKGAVLRPDLVAGGAPQIRTGPVYDPDEGVYKLWTLTATSGVMAATGLHVSRDGVHWTQPRVGQVEVDGARDNNLVAYPFAGGTVGPNAVVYDPRAEAERRYKALAYHRPTHAMSLATSPDGVRWTGLDVTLPSYDEFNLSYDGLEGQFLATLKVRGPFGRSHALATSRDFVEWTTPELIFHADEADQALAREVIAARLADPTLRQPVSVDAVEWATDVYNFGVARYEGLYVGFAAFFYHTGRSPAGSNHDGFHHVQLACSRDLRTWTRLGEREAFIGPSPVGAGAYDTVQILPPSFPVVRGESLWFYYTGLKHRVAPPDPEPDWGGVCLATLRRDGFVSLEAADVGMVTTRPLRWTGETLYVNADARDGSVLVELLGPGGAALAGYGAGECEPLAADGTRQAVRWRGASGLPGGEEPVRLRFRMERAHLYSYWVE